MNRRALTLLPILLGGATGAAFALVGAEPLRPAVSSKVAQATGASDSAPAVMTAAPPEGPSLESSAPVSTPSGATEASPPALPSAAPEAQQGNPTSSVKVGSAVFDLSALSTSDALLATEVRCNEKSPEDCERAAETLEQGKLTAKDSVRAMKLRRIALTHYVKQCNTGRPSSCARLSEMYEQGILVKQNQRSAIALRDRVSTLCKTKIVDPMCR